MPQKNTMGNQLTEVLVCDDGWVHKVPFLSARKCSGQPLWQCSGRIPTGAGSTSTYCDCLAWNLKIRKCIYKASCHEKHQRSSSRKRYRYLFPLAYSTNYKLWARTGRKIYSKKTGPRSVLNLSTTEGNCKPKSDRHWWLYSGTVVQNSCKFIDNLLLSIGQVPCKKRLIVPKIWYGNA